MLLSLTRPRKCRGDAQDQIIDADMIASGRVTKAANLTDAHGVGKGLISGHVYMATPGGNTGAAYDDGNVKLDGITVGFGLPLIALLPIGLATELELPGLSDFAAQANAQIQNFNTQIQQQMGIFNPQMASQVNAINAKLTQYGTDIATVVGGLALIAAGILAGTIIYDNCSPDGGSSITNLELKGSSGKTYAGSSEQK